MLHSNGKKHIVFGCPPLTIIRFGTNFGSHMPPLKPYTKRYTYDIPGRGNGEGAKLRHSLIFLCKFQS